MLGVSTHGINPFGNQRSTHKTLTIFVLFYTLPPWHYMKRKYIQIVMIFQGPTQPGNGINLYLELLKEELLTLWVVKGVKTWDASKGKYFHMRVTLLTMMHDYLVYRHAFGQVCHEHCGRVKCMDDTTFDETSKANSCKIVFMGR